MKMNNLLAHGKKTALMLLLAISLGSCKQKDSEEFFQEEVTESKSDKLGYVFGLGLFGIGMYGMGFASGRKSRGDD